VPDITLLLQHGLLYGAILSVLMSIAFIGTAYLNPEIWLSDYPPDIREEYGPIGERAKRQRKLVGIPVFLLLFGTIVFSIFRFAQLGGELTFFSAFMLTFVMLMVFNLVDLLVLDWLIFVTIQPRIIVLPGTEGMEGYRDYGFHFRAFLKGVAGSLIAGLIVAGVVVVIDAFVL
jgi:hypothetical protein